MKPFSIHYLTEMIVQLREEETLRMKHQKSENINGNIILLSWKWGENESIYHENKRIAKRCWLKAKTLRKQAQKTKYRRRRKYWRKKRHIKRRSYGVLKTKSVIWRRRHWKQRKSEKKHNIRLAASGVRSAHQPERKTRKMAKTLKRRWLWIERKAGMAKINGKRKKAEAKKAAEMAKWRAEELRRENEDYLPSLESMRRVACSLEEEEAVYREEREKRAAAKASSLKERLLQSCVKNFPLWKLRRRRRNCLLWKKIFERLRLF